MEVVYERCSGLDVHKKSVMACVITPEGKLRRTFSTMTADLLALGDWLVAHGVTHVAMESTGVYWQPVYNLLEGLSLTILVVNARHIKAVPGRKTDVRDADWIADLLRHGLVRGSFIPDRPQRELRQLVRFRRSLAQERSQAVNRIQKVLEGANIKLSAVVSDVLGVTGRAILTHMVAGEDSPAVLAQLAKGSLRRKRLALEASLQGVTGSHQRMLLGSLLRQVAFLEDEIAGLDAEVAQRVASWEDQLQRLDTIPGIGRRSAENLLAEIGIDMTRFPSARHLASWARVCPGTNESAGKQKSGRTGRGNPWLRSALVEAAWGAVQSRDTYLAAQYHRLAARRGSTRAIMAVAYTILVTVYHLLLRQDTYRELGSNYFDERRREVAVRRSVRRIERLGYKVVLEAA